jgi:hypothetical protein
MTDRELTRILKSTDEALEVFQTQKGTLTAREISVKSMLHTLRMQIMDQLNRVRAEFKD